MNYGFGDFELDARLFRLRRGAEVIRLQPKVFSVLHYLVEHNDRVVSKQELFDEIWPDEALTESVLARTIAVARKALGQKRGERQPIETDYGRGYRFTSPVRTLEDRGEPTGRVKLHETTRPEGSDDPYVGRGPVVDRLHGLLADALSGSGRLCLLVGEPGIGKTRTAEEIAREAARKDASVWTARCFEGEGSPAVWLWIQILRACIREDGKAKILQYMESDPILHPLVPELGGSHGERKQAFADDAAEMATDLRFRVFDGLARFLRNAAASRPRMLVLDDLHWADVTSLQALSFIVQEIADSPILIVATIRDRELAPGHPNRTHLDQLIRARVTERIELTGLDAGEIASYIELFTGDPAPPELAQAVYAKSEGNPFFMRQSLQLLVDHTGSLADPDGERWRVEVPNAARDVIRRRLSRLDVEMQAVLEVAAVIGREFEFPLLERATQLSGQALLDVLGEALALGLIEELPRTVGQYGFSHALIAETLYEDLSTRRRVALHRKVGEALQSRFDGSDRSHLGEMVNHFRRALPDGTGELALRYAREAGDAARGVYAFEEAAQHYNAALEALDYVADPDPIKRFRLLQDLGLALGQAGKSKEAIPHFERSIEVARQLDDPKLLASAALGACATSRIYYHIDADVRAWCGEALQRLPPDERTLRARLLIELARMDALTGDVDELRELSAQITELTEGKEDPSSLFRLHQARLFALQGPAKLDEAQAVVEEILALSDRTDGRLSWAMFAKRARYMMWLERGEIGKADRDLEDCARISEEEHFKLGRWFVDVATVGRAIAEGRFEDAEPGIARVEADGQLFQSPAAAFVRISHTNALSFALGREITDRDADFDVDSYGWAGALSKAGAIAWLARVGRVQEARRHFDRVAVKDFTDIQEADNYLAAMTDLALTAVILGDSLRCDQLHALLSPYGDRNAVQTTYLIRGAVPRFLGLLAEQSGRGFSEHFDRGIEMADRMGFRPAAAETRFEYARALRRAGRGSAAQIATLCKDAKDAAHAMGMQWLVKAADGL